MKVNVLLISLSAVLGSAIWEPAAAQDQDRNRERMRSMETEEEREAYRAQHHAEMQQRAGDRGVEIPEDIPGQGKGKGKGKGKGP